MNHAPSSYEDSRTELEYFERKHNTKVEARYIQGTTYANEYARSLGATLIPVGGFSKLLMTHGDVVIHLPQDGRREIWLNSAKGNVLKIRKEF